MSNGHSPFAHWPEAIQPRENIELTTRMAGADGLPPAFQFSQNSLQDYADCPRRFQLRYITGLRWPAVQSEPVQEHEQFVQQGIDFHLLAQRHQMGLPIEDIRPTGDPLALWWDNYLRFPPAGLPEQVRYPEIQFSTALSGFRLMAKIDLLAVAPGERIVIVDWKTTRKRPDRATLSERLQSRVYPFVVVEAASHLFGGTIQPEQVSLMYWFAQAPINPEVFGYSAADHTENTNFLSTMIAEILNQDEPIWPLTPEDFHCRYCVYRSLCDRGVRAGNLDEGGLDLADDEPEFDIDWENIEAIAF
nr:PD-(D/E)XK nuclease family protein [Anaerolineae bacterium]